MAVLVAVDGDRLEVIYHENHDIQRVSYLEFLGANRGLLHKDLLDAGDRVNLIESSIQDKIIKRERVTLW